MLGTLWWASIPSRRSSNIPGRFMLQKLELSTSLMGHLARKQTLPLPLSVHMLLQRESWKEISQTHSKFTKRVMWRILKQVAHFNFNQHFAQQMLKDTVSCWCLGEQLDVFFCRSWCWTLLNRKELGNIQHIEWPLSIFKKVWYTVQHHSAVCTVFLRFLPTKWWGGSRAHRDTRDWRLSLYATRKTENYWNLQASFANQTNCGKKYGISPKQVANFVAV